jgi:CMP/dCMP kinase
MPAAVGSTSGPWRLSSERRAGMVGPAMAPAPAKLVVIDGPAGAGKTTVARRLAQALGVPLLDTGAIYRTLALVARRRGIAWDDEPALVELCAGFPIAFGELPQGDARQPVHYGDEDVTFAIRTPDISQGASKVSALAGVRAALLDIQRELGSRGVVAEGRDMGTVVFPDAPYKFFLTADLPTRARRRAAELAAGGGAPELDEVAREIAERDARDSNREAAPLRRADDAIAVDTSGLGIDEVIEALLQRIQPARG